MLLFVIDRKPLRDGTGGSVGKTEQQPGVKERYI